MSAATVVAVVLGKPDADTIVISQDDTRDDDGNYKNSYETSDGIRRSEEGTLSTASNGEKVITVEGQYEYTGPDGKVYLVKYSAGEKGYQAKVINPDQNLPSLADEPILLRSALSNANKALG